MNIAYENLWIPVNDHKINAWWIEGKKEDSPVILYLHGNNSNLGDLPKKAKIFYDLGLSILLIDYRGYGKSSSIFPSEKTVYEDAEVALQYLLQDLKISEQNIFVYGHSLGSAIAIELADRYSKIGGVIVESSLLSIEEMIDYYVPYQIFPKDLILTQYFDSISKVKHLKVPILFLHGSSDKVVPVYMSQQLFLASPGKKYLLIIPTAGHDNIAEIGGKKYQTTVFNFIQSFAENPL